MVGASASELRNSYDNFRSLVEAGHGVLQSLEFIRQSSHGLARGQADGLLRAVRAGSSLHEAMRAQQLPDLDVALIAVAEMSGSLPLAAGILSRHYAERLELEKAIKGALLMPAILLTVSLFASAAPHLVAGRISAVRFAFATVVPIAALGGLVVAGFSLARKSLFSQPLRLQINKVLGHLPWISGLRDDLAAERFFACYGLSLSAGCDFNQTAHLLDRATAGTRMQAAVRSLKAGAGKDGIAKSLARTGLFTREQNASVSIGEESGTLDRQMAVLAARMRDQVRRKIDAFTVWAPRLLYFLAGAYVVFNLVQSVKDIVLNPVPAELMDQ